MERGYKIYDINELTPGDHLCVIYETDDEHKALITPYLRSGLENHEKVFYIVDARTSEVVLNYLRDDGVDVDPYLESGQLAILTVSESYMKDGVFDPDGMIKMLTEETEKALEEGYSALRVTGEMSWALRGLPGSERLIEYEAKLNEFFPTNKALAICQYDRRAFDPEILLDILTTHPIAVIGTEIYENFYYIPPAEFLGDKIQEVQLNHWIENLHLRKQMEEELKTRELRFLELFNNIDSGVAVYAAVDNADDFILKDFNPAAEQIEGVRKEDIVGMRITEVFPGIKEFGLFEVLKRVWKTGKSEYFPAAIYKDENDPGSWRENRVFNLPSGEIVAVYNDITERVNIQKALEISEKHYHTLFENMLNGFAYCKMLFDEAGRPVDWIYIDVNRAFGHLTGLENIVGKKVTEAIPGIKESNPELFEIYGRVALNGKPETFETYLELLNLWLNISVFSPAKEYFVAVFENVTERKQAEEKLRKSEEKYRIIVEKAQEGIWSIDTEGITTFVNQRMADILGYSEEEMIGRQLFSFMDEEGVKLAKYYMMRREQGIKEQHDFEFIRKDSNKIYTSLETSPLTDEKGNYIGALAIVGDITKRKQMEEQIKKSLEEKEMLLKEIHHRVKNNLMIISSLLDLQSQYIKDKTSLNIFKESQNRARSMALIHERLYQSTDLKRIDIGDYIQSLSTELFHTYTCDFGLIELKINVEDVMLDINIAIPLGLIVNELVTNSLKHAFPEGMKGEINVDFHLIDDHYQFTVRDNGIGFPFDLDFQNTDSLGLQIVNSLTKQIDAKIQLDRSKGTEFKITFKELTYNTKI